MKFMIFNFEENSKFFTPIYSDSTAFDNNSGVLDGYGVVELTIEIPLLPALSVQYVEVSDNYYTKDEMLDDTRLRLTSLCPFQFHNSARVIVHYNGIRDHSLLFPWINDESLRKRLGEFYEEAEKGFDNASWLSFSLMCAAIFEGMLFAKGVSGLFQEQIDKAASAGIIDNRMKNIMHQVRGFRNLVHANNHSKTYVSRASAMDIRSVLDNLIVNYAMA